MTSRLTVHWTLSEGLCNEHNPYNTAMSTILPQYHKSWPYELSFPSSIMLVKESHPRLHRGPDGICTGSEMIDLALDIESPNSLLDDMRLKLRGI